MSSITLHNIDDDLDKTIREIAEKKGLSLNKTIKQILRNALQLGKRKKSDFSDIAGKWSKKEFESFQKSTQTFSEIDEEEWK